jgi:beta-barrel assembly-enhancing protease
MPLARGAALVLVLALTSACAAVEAARPVPSLPADVQERTLLVTLKVLDDATIAELLGRVTGALLSDEGRAATPPEIVVVRDPSIGAFVLPRGRIYVHSGLLARLENEAQLATVLARALTLARMGPALERRASSARMDEVFNAMPATIATALAAEDGGGVLLSPTAAAILGNRLSVPYVAAVTGYGRELETEADAGALRRVVRAGYDPKQAPKAFERLRREARIGGPIERFFLGREAVLGERIETLTRLVATDYMVAAAMADTITTTDEFVATVALASRENARLELRMGRFRQAQEQLDRALAARPADALAHLYYGDVHRLRAQRARGAADRDDLARRALAAYERCASLDPEIIDVARQIGLLYYQQGRFEQAREAFTRYVSRSPEAPDAPRVQEYLAALGGR